MNKKINGPTTETVTSVTHYTDKTFSFTITRPTSFRFRSGEFVMIGLMDKSKPLLRAYSIASPNWDEKLEFYSIKVPDGPLTSKLQKINVGDEIILGRKPVGTLVLDALKPGKRLYMFSTGTGVAPFASVIRDPETYEKFDQVILTHTCREIDELTYSNELIENIKNDELLSEMVDDKLVFYDTVTREEYDRKGRITDLISNGTLFTDLGIPTLNPETDRVMICGSTSMLNDIASLAENAGLTEGSNSSPAEYVIEKSFVG